MSLPVRKFSLYLQQRGLTTRAFAQLIGYSYSYAMALRNGTRKPPSNTLETIANRLSISPQRLRTLLRS